MLDDDFLAAVARLPEVGDPILRECEGIRRVLARAAELEATAGQLRQQAGTMAGVLRRRIARSWPEEEREAAGLED
ncbi:stable inheritance protein KleA [Achromobacter xylosoxidans]|jgi:hypothetical protein|uniref:stable inheritance protein KleA n=1 Tax=Alcaligenes xylosoxydans xylosoxydans TaxID=85698 RepID=UPI0028B01056|nr:MULTISPECIES: stable inheritance protein KleA [Achromobacter]WOB74351.1 stable inheritance protein KleA [Achromobacter xylosoxidans]